MAIMTTFPNRSEFAKAKTLLDTNRTAYREINPCPGYTSVGIEAVVIDETDRVVFGRQNAETIAVSGWVDFFEPQHAIPDAAPAAYEKDVFGSTAVMVVQPCMADQAKLRAIAHISGDLSEVFPYMNALRKDAFYNSNGPTFTFMDHYRMITLYARRIAMAKVDNIVDIWRVLESLRTGFNECWKNRNSIEPSNELRKKPAALEIYFRLPRTNCGQCGEKACMAFALKLWSGQISLFNCKPVFDGAHANLKEALFEICAGLGVEKG
jgi:ArsR family metal-binding transcriptional regulator